MLTLRPRISGLAVSEQPLGCGIERLNPAVGVDDDDPVHGRFDNRSPLRLTRSQLFFKIHAIAEIVKHARELSFAANGHFAD